MKLQKIDYSGEKVVCLCAEEIGSGERTLCGTVCIEGTEDDDYSLVGKPFAGKLSNITCHDCLNIIRFVKSLG